jgi:hypothetical protein
MENNLLSIDDLKSLYFKDESKLFSKPSKKQDFHIKSTTEILSNIAKNGSFSKVNETYRLGLILKKILLQSHLHWITYSYYKNKKLIIGTNSHIGQSELNMQKYLLIENLKKIERYKDIEGVSIFRDELGTTKNSTIKREKGKDSERSYGIFDNYLQDEKLWEIIERIKKNIRNVNL